MEISRREFGGGILGLVVLPIQRVIETLEPEVEQPAEFLIRVDDLDFSLKVLRWRDGRNLCTINGKPVELTPLVGGVHWLPDTIDDGNGGGCTVSISLGFPEDYQALEVYHVSVNYPPITIQKRADHQGPDLEWFGVHLDPSPLTL